MRIASQRRDIPKHNSRFGIIGNDADIVFENDIFHVGRITAVWRFEKIFIVLEEEQNEVYALRGGGFGFI